MSAVELMESVGVVLTNRERGVGKDLLSDYNCNEWEKLYYVTYMKKNPFFSR